MRKVKTYRSGRTKCKTGGNKRMQKTLQGFLSQKAMGVTQFQSAHTWQNTVIDVNFTKSQRFFRKKNINDMLYNIPTTKTPRYTGFGFGDKQQFSLSTRMNAKYNPSPDRYNITGFTRINKIKKAGKTFGIQHSARKYMGKNRVGPQVWLTKAQPGPHEYDWHKVKNKLKKGNSYTCRPRGIMFNDKIHVDKGFPSPQVYYPPLHMIQAGGYGKIQPGVGLGKKQGMHNHSTKHFPGPGTYTIPTFCDKILKRYATLKGQMVYGHRTSIRPRKKKRRRRRKLKKFYDTQRTKKAEFENQQLQTELKTLIKKKNNAKSKKQTNNYMKKNAVDNKEQKNKVTDDEQ